MYLYKFLLLFNNLLVTRCQLYFLPFGEHWSVFLVRLFLLQSHELRLIKHLVLRFFHGFIILIFNEFACFLVGRSRCTRNRFWVEGRKWFGHHLLVSWAFVVLRTLITLVQQLFKWLLVIRREFIVADLLAFINRYWGRRNRKFFTSLISNFWLHLPVPFRRSAFFVIFGSVGAQDIDTLYQNLGLFKFLDVRSGDILFFHLLQGPEELCLLLLGKPKLVCSLFEVIVA